MSFLDNLKDAVNILSETAKKIEEKQEYREEKNISNMNVTLNNEFIEQYETFSFMDVNFRYQKLQKTNFFITGNDFGALEICDVYLYSKNGVPYEYKNDITDETKITFETWNQTRPNNIETFKNYLREYGINDIKVENKNDTYLKYKVYGESNSSYYLAHFYQIESLEFKIELTINKRKVTKEEIIDILKEYNAIIETLEISLT